MAGRYYYDPDLIEALNEQMREIATLTQSMTEEFVDGLAPTVRWPGTEGDFAEKAGPQERKERQFAKDTMFSIRDAVVSVTDAMQSQIDMVKHRRDTNVEGIDQVNSTIDPNGMSGGDAGHGRR
ncbi:hypothetical protein GCM10010145_11510 [Streptomyces ruber]|uniref:Uncharacterized protein n=2 Tax=Streptomyces TaxID=1883 RepID=A0A918B8M6_9ACTN|nr:hypothetical protein [Streptomyces ruber]GGQ44536.1 hypothetical protein GCM10010145_11510 [Streptomyces ruber]